MKKFYFLLCAMMVALAANATDYYMIGGFNGWTLAQENCKFTPQGDGTYVLDYQGTLTSGFKFNDGTWSNDAANFGGSSTLVLGEVYNLTVGGSSGNITLKENIENPHIVLNPDAATVLITGQSVETKYVYGIHGQIFGDSNWSTTNMTEVNGKWVISGDMVAGDFGIKEMDATTFSQTNWISAANSEDRVVVVDKVIDMKVEGTNLNLPTAGYYTFTFDPEAMTLVVTGDGGVVEPVMAIGIHGNIFGNDWETVEMTQNETVFTLTANVVPGEFGIKMYDANTGEQYMWLAAMNEEGAKVVLDTPLYVTDFNTTNFVLSVGGELTFTFDIDAMLLTVTGEAVTPEPIVPENLYIIGNLAVGSWDTTAPIAMVKNGTVFTAENVVVTDPGYFSLITAAGANWDVVNSSDRYGASSHDEAIVLTDDAATVSIVRYTGGNTGAAYSWQITPDTYNFTVDFADMTMHVVKSDSGVEDIEIDAVAPVYYNLNGVKVDAPQAGLYIEVRGTVARKVTIK